MGDLCFMQFSKHRGKMSSERVAGDVEHRSGGKFRGISFEFTVIALQADELRKGKPVIENLPVSPWTAIPLPIAAIDLVFVFAASEGERVGIGRGIL